MIGDSITDCGRGRPAGEAPNGLGNGYVNLVNAFLGAEYANRNIRVVNMGNSGNTIRHLKNRWESDVLEQKPDWVSVMIGINDVWRQFDAPHKPETHVLLEEYEATLEELVTTTLPHVKGMVLMTPYFIESNKDDPMRKRMDVYSKTVRKIARRHKTKIKFVDVQSEFDKVLKHVHPYKLAGDRIHPNIIGHMIIARAFAIGVSFAW